VAASGETEGRKLGLRQRSDPRGTRSATGRAVT
jgi:hypothetical protein